jgi:hypothetical protein
MLAYQRLSGKSSEVMVRRQGIVLRVFGQLSVLLLDQTEGKMFVNLNKKPENIFPGAVILYSLTTKKNQRYFEFGSCHLISKVHGHCYEKLNWLHEILGMAATDLPLHDQCDQSFKVLLDSIKLIPSQIPPNHFEVIKFGSVASFVTSLGYVRDFFLQEFVELFQQYCRISDEGEFSFSKLDIKIKNLEKNLPYAKNLIDKLRRDF